MPTDTPGILNEVVVNRGLNGTLEVRGIRTDVSVTLFGTQRDFQISENEDVYGIRGTVERRISPRTSLGVLGDWTRNEFDGATADRSRWQVGLGLRRQFSRNFSGSIDVSHVEQDSQNPSDIYEENRVTLRIDKTF